MSDASIVGEPTHPAETSGVTSASDLAYAVDRGADLWAALDARLAAGEIDEAQWYAACQAVIEQHYLAADNPRAQSGHSGDEARWEEARRPVLAAVDADGDLLDVGCASGYLMESVQRWAAQDGRRIEPYGLELSPQLAQLARQRLPHWADRIWTGNAMTWRPDRRFDYVRTCLDYVPPGRAADLVRHLMDAVVGRRLIVGVFNEVAAEPTVEEIIVGAGYRIVGRREWLKPDNDRVARRVLWIDREVG